MKKATESDGLSKENSGDFLSHRWKGGMTRNGGIEMRNSSKDAKVFYSEGLKDIV